MATNHLSAVTDVDAYCDVIRSMHTEGSALVNGGVKECNFSKTEQMELLNGVRLFLFFREGRVLRQFVKSYNFRTNMCRTMLGSTTPRELCEQCVKIGEFSQRLNSFVGKTELYFTQYADNEDECSSDDDDMVV